MTITSVSTPLNLFVNDDAGFRAWSKAQHDTLIAMGLSLEYSGINFDTVTMPTVVNTIAGYMVYELNDTLSATKPIYIKVLWGRGSSTSLLNVNFRIGIEVGTTHNGSGTLGGTLSSQYMNVMGSTTGDNEILGYTGPNGFVVMSNLMAASPSQFLFSVERLAINGVPTTDGATVVLCGYNTNTTGTSSGPAYGSFLNFFTMYVSGAAPIVGGVQAGFGLYNLDVSYADYAPLGRILTFGQYDCLSMIFAGSRRPIGDSNRVYSGLLDGESITLRTPSGSINWSTTNYVIPVVRTS